MIGDNLYKWLLLLLGILLPLSLLVSPKDISADSCLEYRQISRTIEISCGAINLTEIYKAFGPSIIKNESYKVWILNANVKIKNDSTLYINSTDTIWLKINSTTGNAYSIISQGNLRIDSVRLTSWDTTANNYAKISNDGMEPRSYIRSEKGDGTLNINNSELGYLGYNGSQSYGLSYYSGSGSKISNSKIHDLWNGFYSDSIENMTIENNEFYNNVIYGIDPHSGTHDLVIRHNKIYNNEWHGLTCSRDCYNIIIDSNRVFTNGQTGIILHGNTTNSTLTNNTVYDNNQDQISLQNSADNNHIYNNKLSGGISGIEIAESSNNKIHNNTIENTYNNFLIHNGSSGNLIESNNITNASHYSLYSRDSNSTKNIFLNNRIFNVPVIRMLLINNTSTFINNTIGNVDTKCEISLRNDSALVLEGNFMSCTGGVVKSGSGYEPLPLSARLQSKKSALEMYLSNQNLTRPAL
jgi:mannuronan 5-epimerase